jgi:hypothetical protein
MANPNDTLLTLLMPNFRCAPRSVIEWTRRSPKAFIFDHVRPVACPSAGGACLGDGQSDTPSLRPGYSLNPLLNGRAREAMIYALDLGL